MRATSGKSLFTETLYVAQIIRYVIVYGIASEPALASAQLRACSEFNACSEVNACSEFNACVF